MSEVQNEKDAAEFPKKQLESVFLHSLRLMDQDREYLQMHLKKVSDERTEAAFSDMELESARLERTIRELMELSAPEEALKKRPVDLCGILAELERMAPEIQRQNGTTLQVDRGGMDQCLVWADREKAEQLCFHLLSNALRAVSPGGTVWVHLRRTEQNFALTIEDDGCGLPEGESWLENRRRFLGGARAGLPLCRKYCRQLGWTLELSNRAAGGACAALTIPLPARAFPIEPVVEFRSEMEGPVSTPLQRQLRRELYLLTTRRNGGEDGLC